MSHTATIRWSRTGEGDFTKGQYSRAHEWLFDGGAKVAASASPHIVPAPWSDARGVDPEEAFVASLSSCHMLFFVDFARRAGLVVDEYVDEAEGVLEKRSDGRLAITRVHFVRALPGVASLQTKPLPPISTTARTTPASLQTA